MKTILFIVAGLAIWLAPSGMMAAIPDPVPIAGDAAVPDETDCDAASIIVETYAAENRAMEHDGMVRTRDITEYCANQIIIEQFNRYREEYCGIPTSGEGR